MESNYFLLDEKVQNGIKDILKWNSLTSIQEETIPRLLNGDNCVLLAQTAGGKTEAAFFPIISTIYKDKLEPISVIYISPIRALLNNQEIRLKKLGKLVNIDAFKWHGEVDYHNKKKFKIDPKHIIATTPESLEVMLMSNSYDCEELFANIRFVVIDEIHYFAEIYRGSQLISIIERIQSYSKYDIQRIGLSATIGNPEEIVKWMSGSSSRNQSVIIPNVQGNKSKIFIRYFDDFSVDSMHRILPELKDKKSLFFSNGRSDAEMMARILKEMGLNAKVHHSSVSKNLREVAEDKLKTSGEEMCLCCTSTMELGIDVGELDVVMQLGCPSTVASFKQRMGRTGRRQGTISHYEFCVSKEYELINAIAIVELARRKWIESANTAYDAYTVLFQQIYSMIEQKYGLKYEYLNELLKNSKAFENISDEELDEFMRYLMDENYLSKSKEEYIVGSEFEKKFSYNFLLNFSSVFETLTEYSVIYKNKEIGTLQSWFIFILLKENSSAKFTLAGIPWEIETVEHEKYKVYVKKAKEGGLATWLGGGGIVSFEIAQEILKILNDNVDYPYIDNRAKAVLTSERLEHSAFDLKNNEILIDAIKDGYDIYTYAGNKVNFTIGLVLESELGIEFTINYRRLRTKNKDVRINEEDIIKVFDKIRNDALNLDEIITSALIMGGYKSRAKFFDFLPKQAKSQVLKYELVDIKKTIYVIKEFELKIENVYEL